MAAECFFSSSFSSFSVWLGCGCRQAKRMLSQGNLAWHTQSVRLVELEDRSRVVRARGSACGTKFCDVWCQPMYRLLVSVYRPRECSMKYK